MSLDEALALLGVETSATPEEVRRAYLRKIRHRKPEVDPEGFQRLREAYELVRAVGEIPARFAVILTRPRAESAAETSSGPAVNETDSSAAPEFAGDDSRTLDAESEPSPAARIALAPLLDRALEWARGGDLAEAEHWAALALAEDGTAPRLFPLLEIVSRLQSAGHLAAAGRLLERIDERMRGDRDFRQQRSSFELALWALVQEIQRLPLDFPAEVRSRIIAALLEGNPEGAFDELRGIARRDPRIARSARERLYPGTNLHGLFREALAARHPEHALPTFRLLEDRSVDWLRFLLMLFLVGFFLISVLDRR